MWGVRCGGGRFEVEGSEFGNRGQGFGVVFLVLGCGFVGFGWWV